MRPQSRQAGQKLGRQVRSLDAGYRVHNGKEQGPECGGDWVAVKRLPFAEAYVEGRLNISFVLPNDLVAVCSANLAGRTRNGTLNAQLGPLLENESLTGQRLNAGRDLAELIATDSGAISHGENQPVLVGVVKPMKGVKEVRGIGISARIRFECCYFSDNLISRQMHFSQLQGGWKSAFATRERELDFRGCFDRHLVRQNAEHEVVERGSHIMDSVSDDEGECFWDGFFCLGEMGSGACVGVFAGDKFERFASQKGLNLPLKVSDVMCGPFDFQTCRVI